MPCTALPPCSFPCSKSRNRIASSSVSTPGEETFRHQENATYKEGRAETPDEFYLQIPRILELFEAFSIQHVSDAAYEADDFLCAYARLAEKAGMRVTIVTGDRDAFQLAAENIRIAIPHKGYQKTGIWGRRRSSRSSASGRIGSPPSKDSRGQFG